MPRHVVLRDVLMIASYLVAAVGLVVTALVIATVWGWYDRSTEIAATAVSYGFIAAIGVGMHFTRNVEFDTANVTRFLFVMVMGVALVFLCIVFLASAGS